MVCVEIVAQATLVLKFSPGAPYWQICMGIKQVISNMQFLIVILVVAVVPVFECYGSKSLQSASTVFQVQVIVIVPLVVLPRLSGRHQTESVALGLQRLDADHCIHLGVISGTRGRNHIYALNFDRLQLFQFAGVAHLFVIDVYLRLALRQYLELPVFALHHRYHREQVVGCAYIMEDRVLHIYRHTSLSQLVLRYLAFHLYAFHHIGLWLEGNTADVTHTNVSYYRLIAYVRYLQGYLLGLAGDYEIAILIAHTAIYICGIFVVRMCFRSAVQ